MNFNHLAKPQDFPTLVDVARWRAHIHPDRRAYTFLADGTHETDHRTYADLDLQARAIGAVLQSMNLQGERALLVYPPGLDYVVAFLGCLYAGVVAIPTALPRPNRPAPHLHAIVTDSQAAIVLTINKTRDLLQQNLNHLPELTDLHWLVTDTVDLGKGNMWQPPDITGDTLAYLQYTSGSTSAPKGAMITHRNVLHNVQGFVDDCQITPESVLVAWLPHFHDFGLVYCIVLPLYQGFHAVLMPPVMFIQQPINWLNALSRYRATHTGGPNFAYDLCVDKTDVSERQSLDLSSVQCVVNGAEPVRFETTERFFEAFVPVGFRPSAFLPSYGLAETTLRFSSTPLDKGPVYLHLESAAFHHGQIVVGDTPAHDTGKTQVLVACGTVTNDMHIAIVDPTHMVRCPDDQIGEIWIAGASVAQGYWNRPKDTERTFRAYLADTGEGPFLRTGDLGFVYDGQVFITGRMKDLIIVRGRNHYPQDIEHTVEECHPMLRRGGNAAFSVDLNHNEQLVVVQEVERRGRKKLDFSDVIQTIRRTLIEHHDISPYAIVLIRPASIPRTTSGKIQRQMTRAAYMNRELIVLGEWHDESVTRRVAMVSKRSVAPTLDTLQKWMADWIRRRFAMTEEIVDYTRPFVDYGLDSLSGVSMIGELERWLGRSLSPTLLWNYPSIARLADYLERQELEPQVDMLEARTPPASADDTIAIVGLGCRFPGAGDPQSFWTMLLEGVDATSEVPADRWNSDVFYDADLSAPGKMNTRRGGFLQNVDQFDAHFFGIAPREAVHMDPQQRILLEVTWEALEYAGQAPDRLAGSPTGVFIGVSTNDYLNLMLRSRADLDAYVATGGASSIVANRLSYLLDLRGPSIAVDTACSSSLVALHMACQSLRAGECRMAIAGGVNLILTPELTISFSQARLMASDGRCKTFDEQADGYARGEGCGVVVLKRLSDAQRDGNTILALVRGSAVNQDGRSNGMTAPNGWSQQAVIDAALTRAGVAPRDISYVEAHGTGTPLGDPIEVDSLKAVMLAGRSSTQPCVIGSVKTNIGHLESAAGIAGLIKVVLSLYHQAIPPHLHLQKMNPLINLENTPVVIPTSVMPWPDAPRRLAGISSFGFGGTNCHVVLEEAPVAVTPTDQIERECSYHLLPLSARNPKALTALAQRIASFLADTPDVSLPDMCATMSTGRTHFSHRLTVIGTTQDELHTRLEATADSRTTKGVYIGLAHGQVVQRIAFLFSGQGAQAVGMGRQLYETQPLFRAILDECDELLRPHLEQSLLSVLYPDKGVDSPITMTAYTQPVLFAIEYALAKLWQSWGITPSAVMGHSIGEYVAACIAGVFNLEDGLKLVAARGRLMQSLPQIGSMVAVFVDEAQVATVIEPYHETLSVAGINSAKETVISGLRESMDAVLKQFDAAGIQYRPLKVSHAFHSPMMDPILDEFEQVAATVRYKTPSLMLISNITGKTARDDEASSASYWRNHIRQPVRFAEGMQSLHEIGYTTFLEIGPRPILLGLGKTSLADPIGVTWLPSLHPRMDDWQQMLDSLAILYTMGVPIDWTGVQHNYPRQRIPLPSYPFQRESHWIDLPSEPEYTPQPSTRQVAAFQIADPSPAYEITWEKIPATPAHTAPVAAEKWLIFADSCGVGTKLADALRQHGKTCTLIYAGDEYRVQDEYTRYINPSNRADMQQVVVDAAGCYSIVYLWGLDAVLSDKASLTDLEQAQQMACQSVVLLVQELVKRNQSPRLWLMTEGVHQIGGEDTTPVVVAQSLLWGVGRALAHEHPALWGGLVDVQAGCDLTLLAHQLLQPANGEDMLALRGDQVFAARLERSSRTWSTNSLNLNPEASYLITGGLGALGLACAKHLAQHGARHLVLVGRTPLPPYAEWDRLQPGSQAAERVAALRELDAMGCRVSLPTLDVANETQVQTFITSFLEEGNPPIRGVIHAAGYRQTGSLVSLDTATLDAVLRPKVLGGWVLHRATQAMPLDFFVLFSSGAALLGELAQNQAHYAAANAFLDALAHHRRAAGQPALSINWTAWADVGAGATVEGQQVVEYMARMGIGSVRLQQGMDWLSQLIQSDATQVAIIPTNWEQLASFYPGGQLAPFVAHLLDFQEKSVVPAIQEISRDVLQAALPSERLTLLECYLRQHLARILGLDIAYVDPQEPLNTLGMDSLMAIELRNRIEASLGITVPLADLYRGANIAQLSSTLLEQVIGHGDSGQASVEATPQLTDNLDTLSDEQVDQLLRSMLEEDGNQ